MATKKRYTPKDAPEIVTDQRSKITNFEEARLGHRGLDTFRVYKLSDDAKDGEPKLVLEVKGHEIGMSSSESEVAKLPIYQIIEYVEMTADVRVTTAVNIGEEYSERPSDNKVVIENKEGEKEFVNVVKALLWPGEWSFISREYGDLYEDLD